MNFLPPIERLLDILELTTVRQILLGKYQDTSSLKALLNNLRMNPLNNYPSSFYPAQYHLPGIQYFRSDVWSC
jgi:hypothetical protein